MTGLRRPNFLLQNIYLQIYSKLKKAKSLLLDLNNAANERTSSTNSFHATVTEKTCGARTKAERREEEMCVCLLFQYLLSAQIGWK